MFSVCSWSMTYLIIGKPAIEHQPSFNSTRTRVTVESTVRVTTHLFAHYDAAPTAVIVFQTAFFQAPLTLVSILQNATPCLTST